MNIIKQLRVIFFALAAGQILYFVISIYLINAELVVVNKDYSTLLGFIAPLIVVVLVVSSKLLYKHNVDSIKREVSLNEKLISYRTSSIVKFALLEAANVLSITFYLVTGDFLYAGMFVIVMAIFFINIPGKDKFSLDYNLNSDDINKLK